MIDKYYQKNNEKRNAEIREIITKFDPHDDSDD